MGANHARTVFRSEQFRLSFVVDADLERAKALAEPYGAQAVASITEIRDVQAAVVATSTISHFETVKRLLELKIPVLCEKPLTPSLELTRNLIEISKKNSVPIQCGFVERFNPAFQAAKKMIDQPVIHAQSIRHSPSAVRTTSGVAEDLLIHDIDLALTILSSPIRSVVGSVYRSVQTGVDEISDCVINLEDDAVVTLSASRMSQRKIREWRICTEKGLFEVDLLRQTLTIYENINQEIGASGAASYRARTLVDYPFIERAGEPLVQQLLHFSQLLEGKVGEEVERESILASHIVLAEFLRSAGPKR